MSLAEVENQRRRCRGRIRWHYTEGTGEDWAGFLESTHWMAEGFAVKANRQRTVYCAPLGPGDSPKAFVKHIRAARPREFLKALVRCKAREEFESARMLTRAGVPVTRAVAWGRCGLDGFVVTEALEGCCAFEDAWGEAVLKGGAEAEAFLNAFAAFLRTLIEAGVHHPDMHRGNLLVVPERRGKLPRSTWWTRMA